MSSQGDHLPPLPGSDDISLQRDTFDRFYKKRPSDIWTGKVDTFEEKDSERCEHFFVETSDGVQCRKCHFGLIGKELKVKKGHVYFHKQKLF